MSVRRLSPPSSPTTATTDGEQPRGHQRHGSGHQEATTPHRARSARLDEVGVGVGQGTAPAVVPGPTAPAPARATGRPRPDDQPSDTSNIERSPAGALMESPGRPGVRPRCAATSAADQPPTSERTTIRRSSSASWVARRRARRRRRAPSRRRSAPVPQPRPAARGVAGPRAAQRRCGTPSARPSGPRRRCASPRRAAWAKASATASDAMSRLADQARNRSPQARMVLRPPPAAAPLARRRIGHLPPQGRLRADRCRDLAAAPATVSGDGRCRRPPGVPPLLDRAHTEGELGAHAEGDLGLALERPGEGHITQRRPARQLAVVDEVIAQPCEQATGLVARCAVPQRWRADADLERGAPVGRDAQTGGIGRHLAVDVGDRKPTASGRRARRSRRRPRGRSTRAVRPERGTGPSGASAPRRGSGSPRPPPRHNPRRATLVGRSRGRRRRDRLGRRGRARGGRRRGRARGGRRRLEQGRRGRRRSAGCVVIVPSTGRDRQDDGEAKAADGERSGHGAPSWPKSRRGSSRQTLRHPHWLTPRRGPVPPGGGRGNRSRMRDLLPRPPPRDCCLSCAQRPGEHRLLVVGGALLGALDGGATELEQHRARRRVDEVAAHWDLQPVSPDSGRSTRTPRRIRAGTARKWRGEQTTPRPRLGIARVGTTPR